MAAIKEQPGASDKRGHRRSGLEKGRWETIPIRLESWLNGRARRFSSPVFSVNNGGQHGGPNNLQLAIFDSSNLGSALATSAALTGARAFTSFSYAPADLTSANGFTIRLYGWSTAGNAADGFLNLDDFVVNGDLTAVPEPVNVALALFGVVAVGWTAGRRWHQARRTIKRA